MGLGVCLTCAAQNWNTSISMQLQILKLEIVPSVTTRKSNNSMLWPTQSKIRWSKMEKQVTDGRGTIEVAVTEV